jgi:UPF0042 nucleotide-binding protein
MDVVVIAGLSGAGRSTAAATLEDLGWFVIDNLPPALIPKVADLVERPGSEAERVALVVGRSGGVLAEEVEAELAGLSARGARVRVVFLEASDEALIRRFEGTRRRHPLDTSGVLGAIAEERDRLGPLRDRADVVVDTSELNVHELRARIVELMAADERSGTRVSVVSFGYKHGLPLDADLVLDCRFLPNPHWVEELRPMTGLDEPVRDYVLSKEETRAFLDRLDDLLELLLPAYAREGKTYLSVALGCTGGRHRSVAIGEALGERLRSRGVPVSVVHRDLGR